MHWVVVAPFNTTDDDQGWLTPFVPGNEHSFRLVARPPALANHAGGSQMSVAAWWHTWRYAGKAWRQRQGGIVTLFPQLAVTCGLRRRLSFGNAPIVAWCFNMGRLYHGMKGKVARFALRHVEKFIVHSRAEIGRYSEWLDLPPERFEFVHLQRGTRPIEHEEDRQNPFVLSMGSANRDYRTLLEAVSGLKLPTTIVAAPYALEGLDIPANVTIRSGLSYDECRNLAQRARISAVPVANDQTASGQVTFIDAMRMRRPVIATRCVGTEDYIQTEETGLLVQRGSVEEISRGLERLWNDEPLRNRLAANAQRYAEANCSDEAAGRSLKRVLDEVSVSA